jgi:hypothetical protein
MMKTKLQPYLNIIYNFWNYSLEQAEFVLAHMQGNIYCCRVKAIITILYLIYFDNIILYFFNANLLR